MVVQNSLQVTGVEVVNLTPHAINFVTAEGTPLCTVEPSGSLARVSAKTVNTGEVINVLPVTKTEYGEVEGLPEAKADTVYIVSALVAARVPGRPDVFVPAEQVRDAS